MKLYLLGLFTLPALVLFGWLFINFIGWFYYRVMDSHGYSVKFKTNRNTEDISNYALKHDIWYEKQRGPVFTGFWYRENGGSAYATRWLGIGRANGTSFMIFKLRNLGPVTTKEA